LTFAICGCVGKLDAVVCGYDPFVHGRAAA
jgi:hypothetical protein